MSSRSRPTRAECGRLSSMRARRSRDGLSVLATAGTHTVLLGFDLESPAGCLGFGIHRRDHTEREAYWLRGTKVFPSLVPEPTPGMDVSLGQHPVQGFQWGDYTAKPQHRYTYTVVAFGGRPGALRKLAEVRVDVRTEAEDDGRHGIWFNRGVAGSQAFVKRFGHYTPPVDAGEDHPAFRWLSRGLGEAFVRFVRQGRGLVMGIAGCLLRVHLADRARRPRRGRGPRRRPVAGRARSRPGCRRRGRPGPDGSRQPRRRGGGRAGRRGDVAHRRQQERTPAQQVPGADPSRRAGGRVDGIDQHHPGRHLRAPQRRPRHHRRRGGHPVPPVLGPAGPRHHHRRPAGVDRDRERRRPRIAAGRRDDHRVLAARHHQRPADLVRGGVGRHSIERAHHGCLRAAPGVPRASSGSTARSSAPCCSTANRPPTCRYR